MMSPDQALTTDRLDHWIETVCRTYVDLDVTRIDDSPFWAGIDVSHLGDTVFAELAATAQQANRRPIDIARADGAFAVFVLQRAGVMIVAQDGREVRLDPGDAAIVDTERPYTLHLAGPNRQIVLHCPRHLLRRRLRSLRAVTAARIAASSPTGDLLGGTLRLLARDRHDLAPREAEAIGRYTLDLIATALEATPEAGLALPARASAALLARIKDYLRDNLADTELDPARIAAAHSMSVRHLHRLFHETGATVGGALREARLERCRADLDDPGQRGSSVTEIALRWGFNDSAHFSRVFKARFGLSPRAYRGQAPSPQPSPPRGEGTGRLLAQTDQNVRPWMMSMVNSNMLSPNLPSSA
jgi:AraC-like DNA-binding protein